MPVSSDYGTFQPDELMPMIPSLFLPGSFLQLAFFPRVFEFDSAKVYLDRALHDRRRAPFVAPLAVGKARQPRGFQTESIVPASMKEKDAITGDEVLSRLAGEAIGGEMSAADREARIRENKLIKHLERIARTREWMASSILRTGQMTIVGDEYPAALVNYGRTGSLTKTLAGALRWGEVGVSPYDNLDGWINEVGEASGSAVNIVVMDRLAWQLYAADAKVKTVLDTTLKQTAAYTLGLTPAVPGAPIYKGSDGAVEFYVYNDIHELESGATEKLVPDYTVMAVSQGGFDGAKLCGVVQHADNHYLRGEYFPHEWIDPNSGAQWIETITAPILAPARIDASLCATVR